jgi:hypothetical protein
VINIAQSAKIEAGFRLIENSLPQGPEMDCQLDCIFEATIICGRNLYKEDE